MCLAWPVRIAQLLYIVFKLLCLVVYRIFLIIVDGLFGVCLFKCIFNLEEHLLIFPTSSICISVQMKELRITGEIFMKFDISVYYESLSSCFSFHVCHMIFTVISHEDLHMFLSMSWALLTDYLSYIIHVFILWHVDPFLGNGPINMHAWQ
jgi:hypothetical protein